MSDIGYVRTNMLPEQAPPNTAAGPVKWAQENLFSGWMNSILTLISIAFLYVVLSNVLPWIFYGSWTAGSLRECREVISASLGEGSHGAACWAVIRERYLQLLYGFYPSEYYWRINLGFVLMLIAIAPVLFSNLPRKMLYFSAIVPFLAFWLFWGGSIFTPILTMIGFALGYLALSKLGARFGLIVGTIAAVLVPVFWWLFAVSAINTGISGYVANSRMDTVPAQLEKVLADETTPQFTLDAARTQLGAFATLRTIDQAIADAPDEKTRGELLENKYTAQREAGRVGLVPVESAKFGGFMLSIIIGVTGIVMSLPLGILLALGRQSDLFIVKSICVGFIEFIRGVPLITLLFVASTLLNYFLPPGTTFDLILRVVIMVTLFASAYMAEVVRGGLAALPTGQYEAADALGLDYWKATRLVIMPQALKISIPGIVSTFIGLFKDTTLVSIIGLMDPIGLSNNIRADANWNGIVWELYGFIALVFFIFCFSMSRYSMYLERKLKTGH